MSKDYRNGLYFVPLGGSDKIGMNMYAYCVHGKWIVVDAGYGFLPDEYPSMDMCYASAEFLKDFKDDIEGLFITHAHEDHFGAVAHIWPDLGCKVYATPFACGLIKERLKEYHLTDAVELEVVHPSDTIKTTEFEIKFISLTHSVPETCGLLIKTDKGTVFHATDWRFDDGRLKGMLQTDYASLKKAGDEGVDMFVCDSTNIFVDKKQPSEYDIRQNLLELIPTLEGGVAVTCFASNLMRIESLVLAAVAADRTPVLIGRSLETNVEIAKDCGYFADLPKVYSPNEVPGLTSDKALYICTGSQANYRSAMTVIANGESRYVKLDKDYTVVFSAKNIPGNEEKIERMQEKIEAEGAHILTTETEVIHASGHGSKEEIREMYELIRPKIVFPVHGDRRFIREHKRFALECGIQEVASAKNGDLFCLKDGHIEKIEEVYTDVMAVDHGRTISLDSDLIKNRKKIAFNGSLFISAYISKDNKIIDIKLTSLDILEQEDWEKLAQNIKESVVPALERELMKKGLTDELKDLIRGRIRNSVFRATDMKPVTILHIFQQGENECQ